MAVQGALTTQAAFAILMQAHLVPSALLSETTVGPEFVCQSWEDVNAAMLACEEYHNLYPVSHMFERFNTTAMKRPYEENEETGAEKQCVFPAGKRRTKKRYQRDSTVSDVGYLHEESSATQAITSQTSTSSSGSTRTSEMSTSESESEGVSLDSDDVSSDTASDVADADDTSSIYSSSNDSTSSDDTEAIVKRAIEGRLGEDFDELPDSEITKLRAGNMPTFSFDHFKESPVASILPEFLAQMEAANKELEIERAAGTLDARRLEIDDTKDGSESGQYIEMNLRLGVLEEKNGDASSSESESNEGEDQGVMQKLMGVNAKDDTPKARIEEV